MGSGHLRPWRSTAAALTPESIVRLEDATLVMLDQRRLPGERVELRFDRWQDVIEAIRTMAVRGAPAIGIAAAYAVAMAALRSPAGSLEGLREDVERACVGLAGARPTAVNLAWAVDRMRETAAAPHTGADELREALVERRARELHSDEVERCRRIGDHGAELLRAGAQVLTHCNAGALATGGYGTALGVIRSAHRRDPRAARLGGRDPAAAPGRAADRMGAGAGRGSPRTLRDRLDGRLADGAGQGGRGHHRRRPDRRATATPPTRSAPTALAVLARAHGVPFYVAAPTSTIDPAPPPAPRFRSSTGHPPRWPGAAAPDGYGVYNPAFDVTPAELIIARS